MDFPAPTHQPYSLHESTQRTWRRAWLVTAAIAALELVALIVVALAFIAKPFADDASSKSAAKADQTAAAGAVLPRAETPVLVLNGNGVEGSAGATANRVRRLDYPVVDVGDASRRTFTRTLVMYSDGARAAGARLATDLGLPARRAVPLDGMRAADLDGAQIVVVVGRSG